eukprot:TRINITY_DN48458_c0_g1_i1.p1 TRINITY_DN48458_c0_g1~~TRINITY_DN48458_c0_g1_i1.p1  ORF type:complete len:228 (-),score=40.78 TRINITY_DN48458_c0_g1_i1:299-982(-)
MRTPCGCQDPSSLKAVVIWVGGISGSDEAENSTLEWLFQVQLLAQTVGGEPKCAAAAQGNDKHGQRQARLNNDLHGQWQARSNLDLQVPGPPSRLGHGLSQAELDALAVRCEDDDAEAEADGFDDYLLRRKRERERVRRPHHQLGFSQPGPDAKVTAQIAEPEAVGLKGSQVLKADAGISQEALDTMASVSADSDSEPDGLDAYLFRKKRERYRSEARGPSDVIPWR